MHLGQGDTPSGMRLPGLCPVYFRGTADRRTDEANRYAAGIAGDHGHVEKVGSGGGAPPGRLTEIPGTGAAS